MMKKPKSEDYEGGQLLTLALNFKFRDERDYYLEVAAHYEKALRVALAEASGCGPKCSHEFLRVGVESVKAILSEAIKAVEESK